MKIEAKTANGFLLSASPDEIANILGYDKARDIPDNKLELGKNVNVTAVYNLSKGVRAAAGRISAASAELKIVTGDLDAINVSIP